MHEPASLIEVRCLRNICRNHTAVPQSPINTVDLNRQQNGNAYPLQILGEPQNRRSAPAVTEENDARSLLLLRREMPISISIQPSEDLLSSRRRSSVLIHRCMEPWNGLLGQPLNDLHLWMPAVVILHKSTDETDHNSYRM